MGAAARPRWAVVFLMILTLGVSLGLSAEDVLDAVYDESETLPFEVAPQSPSAEEQLTGGESQVVVNRVSASGCGCIVVSRERQLHYVNPLAHPAADPLFTLSNPLRC